MCGKNGAEAQIPSSELLGYFRASLRDKQIGPLLTRIAYEMAFSFTPDDFSASRATEKTICSNPLC